MMMAAPTTVDDAGLVVHVVVVHVGRRRAPRSSSVSDASSSESDGVTSCSVGAVHVRRRDTTMASSRGEGVAFRSSIIRSYTRYRARSYSIL